MSDPFKEQEDEVPAGHSYDGIQEYDNPTPFWWNMIFAGSILFAPLYIVWYHSPYAPRSQAERYNASLAANLKLQFGELGTLVADEPTILKYMNEREWLTVGESTFLANCASCHGRKGEGISGPNLTDDSYLHVKRIADIGDVIKNGAKAGAMPAWGNRLHPNEIVLAAAYVAKLRGKNLPSKRSAEGKLIAPWPDAPASEPSGDKAAASKSKSSDAPDKE